jgi:flagellar basal-body rod protein FlgC
MDYSKAFAISAAGMAVERTRVDVAALNLANANTVQGPEGTGYQPLRVVARAAAVSSTGIASLSFGGLVEQALDAERVLGGSLPLADVEPTSDGPRLVYDPGNPLANEKGFVAYPAVDTATEMVTLMGAVRAYESNVAAMNTARTLALKALEIGGAS